MSKLMQAKTTRILLKCVIAITFWSSYVIPIYAFERLFRLGIHENNLWGVYNDAVWIFSLLAVILTLLFLWLSPKFFHNTWYKIAIVIVYLVFYQQACTSIAWDYRSVFGATWLWSEIFLELVAPHWYFYGLGALGIAHHYLSHWLISSRKFSKE